MTDLRFSPRPDDRTRTMRNGGPHRLVIVGGVAGGASCAARARRLSEDAQITVVERGPHVSFANCGLPYHLGHEIPDRGKLVVQTPAGLRQRFNLDVRVDTTAVGIDRVNRLLLVRHASGAAEALAYDTLVLSPGAKPITPALPGIDRPGHFALRNIPDLDAIVAWVDGHHAKRAVIAGGGYIGLEVAEQLVRRGLEVAVAHSGPHVMNPLDDDMAGLVHSELRKHGLTVHLNDAVVAFDPPAAGAQASIVRLSSGVTLPADVVLLGMGVRPEVDLARDAGLEIGRLGGIRVDSYLQTSDPAIYAVGDAIEVRHRVTDQWSLIPLAGPANRQGRLVADNLLGTPRTYPGTLGTAILRVFDLTIGMTGANERQLRDAGIPHRCVHLHPGSHAGYFPGAKPIGLKLLFGRNDGRILGAQAIGEDGVDKRIDVIATAILAGMDVRDLSELELSYAPPYGSAKDPVNLAGMAASNVLNRLVDVIRAEELAEQLGNVFVLDVRDAQERAASSIPGSVHIPLGELRVRLNELPRERVIVVHCASGQRSYYACRVLMQRGFQCRNLSGAMKTWTASQAIARVPKPSQQPMSHGADFQERSHVNLDNKRDLAGRAERAIGR